MAPRAREYQPGERVPGTVYAVERCIGAGGMGTVYDVEDTSIGKRYVLKTLHPQLGNREDLARRMQSEARTLAKLNHPNIVEVITAGVTADDLRLPFYVMERLNGQSLRLILEKRGQLDIAHAYHIAIDLLDALDHAHDKGVIHRDVKPDNIFLHRTTAGVTLTKLLDFGIMSLLDVTMRETAGRFLGTLRYAAPEQLQGEKPTAKVDVYAAALVLFEMIAGQGPFDREGDAHKIAAAHIHKPAPLLSHFVVIPRELDALIAAALSKLPQQRPRDAFSFASSLRNMKKALSGAAGSANSTENRATASALVGAESGAPYVHVQPPSRQGNYVIAPAGPLAPIVQGPVVGPQTTQQGMSAPSVGPSLAPFESTPLGIGSPRSVGPGAVDREAPTHSYVPEPMPPALNGTGALEPFVAAPTLPSDAPPPASVAPFRWPAEPPAARSEEAQIRSLYGAAPAPPRNGSPIVAAVLLMGLLAAVTVALMVVRYGRAASGAARSPAAAPSQPIVASAPPLPAPVLTLPAPTLALPPIDEAPSATASAIASAPASPAPVPTASPAATPTRVPKTSPAPSPIAHPTFAPRPAPAPTRPGPGF